MGADSSLSSHKFIVIGSEHYNPLGVIRSLGEAGIASIAIVRRGQYQFASASKYIDVIHLIDDYNEVFEVLDTYKDPDHKAFIIPCDDVITSILDKEFDKLKNCFYLSNAGAEGRITHYAEKERQLILAEKHGLNVAKTWAVGKDGSLPDGVLYPVITKPIYSYDDWKQDYYICSNESELTEALGKTKGPVFLQQYITKKTELAIDGVSVNRGRCVLPAIESTYTYALPDYYSSEMVVSNCRDERLRLSLQTMLSEIGYEGIFEAEFMVDENGELWFLEINFRNSTWSYASTSLGMNLPLLFARGMLDGKFPDDSEKKIPENYIALAELMDFLQRVMKYKMISPLEWVKCVRRANCLFFYSKNDKRPFWNMCRYQVVKVFKGFFGR